MARINKEAILALCSEINKKQGDGYMYTLGSESANLKIKRWSTGIEDLDAIIGGGMPEGRTIEIYGPESSGKTTLLYYLYAQHELAVHFPVEGTFEAARAEAMGCGDGLLIGRADCGEDCMNKTIKFARQGVPLIGIDSVPSLEPRDDIEKTRKAVNKDSVENRRIGGIARLLNDYLPELERVIEFSGTTIIFANQIRDKMNAMPWGDTTQTPGGHKLRHSASLRIQVGRRGWIDIPNYNPKNSADKEKVGIIMKCRVVKSKVCEPMGECEIPLFFEKGFVSFASLKEVREQVMAEHKQRYKDAKKNAREVDDWGDEEQDEWG